MTLKVSVIVPVYNTKKYLKRCVDSLCSQTLSDIEIILIDDGSSDGSSDLCDLLAAEDSRIIVIHQSNAGVSAARNAGIVAARGEYIAFADSDDYWDTDAYRVLYTNAIGSGAEVSACNMNVENKDGSISPHTETTDKTIMSAQEAITLLLIGKTVSYSLCDKVFKRETVKDLRLDTKISHNEDFLFCYEAIKRCTKVAFSPQPLYYYCYNEESAVRKPFSHKNMTAIDAQDIVLNDIKKRYKDLYLIALREYLKVNLYTAANMAESGYDDSEDIARVRNNVKRNLWQLLTCSLAAGYKLNGAFLCLNYKLFIKHISRKR